MAETLSRYERAKRAFDKASKRAETVNAFGAVCDECGEPMQVIEQFRGSSYYVTGKCPNGHTIERFGRAETETK